MNLKLRRRLFAGFAPLERMLPRSPDATKRDSSLRMCGMHRPRTRIAVCENVLRDPLSSRGGSRSTFFFLVRVSPFFYSPPFLSSVRPFLRVLPYLAGDPAKFLLAFAADEWARRARAASPPRGIIYSFVYFAWSQAIFGFNDFGTRVGTLRVILLFVSWLIMEVRLCL